MKRINILILSISHFFECTKQSTIKKYFSKKANSFFKKKYLLLILLILPVFNINGQQIYLEAGIENAFFINSDHEIEEKTINLKYYKLYEFFAESGYSLNIYKKRLKWESGVSFNKFKIITGFSSGKECLPVTYNLSAIGLKTGFNFSIVNEPFFKIQIHSHLSNDWLIIGKNAYKNVVKEFYNDTSFNNSILRFHKGVSVEYIISEEIASYISFSSANSLRTKNQNSNLEESYTFRSNSISFGILFSLKNY